MSLQDFRTMSHVADAPLNAPPSSPQLQATVQRAFGYADEQRHRQVTPEHLLLALTEDGDSVAVLQRRGIDLDRLRHDVAALMGRNNDRFALSEAGPPVYGADFRRVMNIAAGAASPRRPIDGALMLSALIADGVTPAAEVIKLYGLTFEDTARTSRPLRTSPLPPVASPSLANVRSHAREAALGYRLRKDPPEDFVAVTPGGAAPQRDWPPVSQDDDYAELPAPINPNFDEAPWQPADARAGHPDWTNYAYPDTEQPGVARQEAAPANAAPAQSQRSIPRSARPSADAVPRTKGRKPTGKARRPSADNGLMLENVPRRMVMGTSMSVEARIARRDIEAAILDLRMPGQPMDSNAPVTHAMTVRLRSPDGAMIVESASPETQWVESTLGLLQDDFSSWRWTITPRWSGTTQLQLMVSARAVTPQGLLGETALPEQTVGTTVVSNYRSILASVFKWVGIAMAAGVVGAVGEHMLKVVGRILTH